MSRKRRRRRPHRPHPRADPSLVEPDWVVGYTAGGFPYPAEPFEEDAWYDRWSTPSARGVFEEAFALAEPRAQVVVGPPLHVESGASRIVYRAPVGVRAGDPALAGDWIALLPARADPELAAREAREVIAIAELRAVGFPFRLPEALAGWVTEEGAPVLVERFVHGLPLDFRGHAVRPAARPWELLGRVAAAVHAVPTTMSTVRNEGATAPSVRPSDIASSGFATLPGPATRRAFALQALETLECLEPELRVRVEEWAHAHLPPEVPTGLVHGGLHSRKVLVDIDAWSALAAGEAVTDVGIVGWESARPGDPAWDLAILTRGARRPFGERDGLERLLEAWHAAGGNGVTAEHVRLYELTILALLAAAGDPDAPLRIEAMLRRLGA